MENSTYIIHRNSLQKEGITVEYKREYSDTIKKSIIAFANTEGGNILIENLCKIIS